MKDSTKDWSPTNNPTVRALLAIGRNRSIGTRYRRRLEHAFGSYHLQRDYCEHTALRLAQGIWNDEWQADQVAADPTPQLEWFPNERHLVAFLIIPQEQDDEDKQADRAALPKGYYSLPDAGLLVRPLMALPHRLHRLMPMCTLLLRFAHSLRIVS